MKKELLSSPSDGNTAVGRSANIGRMAYSPANYLSGPDTANPVGGMNGTGHNMGYTNNRPPRKGGCGCSSSSAQMPQRSMPAPPAQPAYNNNRQMNTPPAIPPGYTPPPNPYSNNILANNTPVNNRAPVAPQRPALPPQVTNANNRNVATNNFLKNKLP